jgi:hypothetical protein
MVHFCGRDTKITNVDRDMKIHTVQDANEILLWSSKK